MSPYQSLLSSIVGAPLAGARTAKPTLINPFNINNKADQSILKSWVKYLTVHPSTNSEVSVNFQIKYHSISSDNSDHRINNSSNSSTTFPISLETSIKASVSKDSLATFASSSNFLASNSSILFSVWSNSN